MVAPAKYRKPITEGVDFNYYEVFEVASATFGEDTDDGYANVWIPIRGPVLSFYLINSGSNPVEYSFNGSTVHGYLDGNSERLYSFRRVSKIWFKVPGASTTVRLEAWLHP